jgi:hypothetical protein
MTLEQFWHIIEMTKLIAVKDGFQQKDILIQILCQYPIADILDFDYLHETAIRRANTSHLWAVSCVVHDGCSDDCFDHFRSWLIAQGQKTFELALEFPDSLVETIKLYIAGGEPASQGIWGVCEMAYKRQTGRDDYWDLYRQKWANSTPEVEVVFDWDDTEESLRSIIPNVFAEFGM